MWRPATTALTHLGTLGTLGMVMVGALYQMVPVVAGRPVPGARFAHGVWLPLTAGVAALVGGLWSGHAGWLHGAVACLALALSAFVAQLGVALARPGSRDHSVTGMRLALVSLVGVATIGLVLAHGRATGMFPAARVAWLQVHVTLGLLGWVGGLVTAVAWKVLPMFYLAPELPSRVRGGSLVAIAAGLVGPLAGVLLGVESPLFLGLLALPAAAAAWLLQPVLLLRSLAARRRKRVDGSFRFWQASLGLAPVTALLAAAAILLPDGRWPLLFGWVAIWGHAALVVHGMLTRIVPFLVWYHRFSSVVGTARVPAMRELLPDRAVTIGLALHLGALVAGVVAVGTGVGLLARLTGLLVCGTGLSLAGSLFIVLKTPRVSHA
ncbi:MAG: hypothetical protein D6798_14415 [Deltaproteobacteria bacterium]|nr:MAG: hypothetical protein D6798_14415 [Deltaproteobacteria bacterium]